MLSRNFRCRGKAVTNTHFCVCVCVCVCVGGGFTGVGVYLRACSLTNPACIASPYCHLRPLWLLHISRHYFINGTIFGKKSPNTKCAYWLSLQCWFETSLIPRRIQPGIVINVKKSSCEIGYLLLFSDFNETWIFSTCFRKKLKYAFSSKSVQWKPSCFIQTDSHTWRNQ